ncbi:hypothetical protein SKAU_G00239930 [Synaphobranchus kaupii]|uniref:trypsin n=1 Tax=Synaphobranchus kaupii TaxID=118154 RepID=A0A9Q1F7A3_SYNKA|nr:hypothetical protein SKAU_G00239930 [Synaphobranchus kaupii]
MIGTSLLLLHLLLQLSPAGTSESSIIGGKKAKPHSRPYMVSLQVNGSHTCGGFLIREDFVLTAAHCFSLSPLTAVLGAENLKKKEKKSQQKIPVRKCYKHPMNDKSKYDFDIMLLKLKRNATLNKNVKVIQLPAKGETVPENTKCLMSGWGRKRPDETPPALLQEVTLMVLSNKDCRKIWKEHFVPNRMMCTRFDGKGICEVFYHSPSSTHDTGRPQTTSLCSHPAGHVKCRKTSCRSPTMLYLFLLCLNLQLLAPTGASNSGISRGKEAKPHSRPYMVSLQFNGGHVCGGLLIRKDFVLTSGHCREDWLLEAVLGAHNISKNERTQQRIQAEKYHLHPKYTVKEHHDDMMLLKLKSKAKLTKYVKVIGLPRKDGNIPANIKCSVAGWGKKRPDGHAVDVLQEITQTIEWKSECRYFWQQYFLSEQMICTRREKKGFCQGDSGGPIICNRKPQGIVAYNLFTLIIRKDSPKTSTGLALYSGMHFHL